ncbi:MAG TPA: AAA family ATPase [Gemmataceae bacterium]|nr:AAA family ATPase [Gemmataceae bacterium]
MPPLQLIRLTEIAQESINWVWPGYIPGGKLSLLDGDPDYGKSLISIDIAARLSRGRPLVDGTGGGAPRRTLFINAEDAANDTLRPRLEAAGADFDHVFVLGRDGVPGGSVRIPRHVRRIEELVRSEWISMVVFDPYDAFLSRRLSAGNGQTVRRALGPLGDMAGRTGAAIVLVRHLTKEGRHKALYRGGGSTGIIGCARAALLVADHPKEKGLRVLTVSKSNLAVKPLALVYRVVKSPTGQPVVEWTDVLEMTADEALHPAKEPKREELGILRAAEWLTEALRGGARPAGELIQEALAAGINERTLQRAREAANVITKLVNVDGKPTHWLWKLRPEIFGDFADPMWPELIEVPTGRRRRKDVEADRG